jgi:hypothetical protein
MTRPALKVEVAFNAGYNTPAASRTWTDVTAYTLIVDGIDITHGRGDERSQADANSLRLVLNNKDGRFTPGLATSPYYPNVKLGRPVRVTSTPSGGSASVRFVGYVDEWPLEWPAVVTTFATSTITATSRHARLGSSAPLRNHIYEEYKRDNPAHHYMLDNLADSVAGGVSLAQAGTGTAVTFEGTGPTDGIQAAQFVGGKYLKVDLTTIPEALECFFLVDSGATAVSLVSYGGIDLQVDLTGGVASVSQLVSGGPTVNDGLIHHAALTVSGGTARLYVDGVEVDSGASAATSSGTLYVGPLEVKNATLAHVALFTTAPSATRILAHANSGDDGFAGETAEARLVRYAAFAGIPTAEQSISTAADTPMAHIDTTGQTVLSLLQKVAETDGGVLYDARDDLLTYAARSARYNAAAAVTLTAGQVEASYTPKLDRSSIINEVVATIADGSDPQETVTAIDQDSYDDYGPHRDDIELATTDADEAHAAAWWRVNTYGEPQARAPHLGVEIAHLSTALQASILGLNVGDKITITGLPSQSDASSKSFFVEGYAERIGETAQHFDFNVSPAEPFNVWILGDATYGVLGTTTKLAY